MCLLRESLTVSEEALFLWRQMGALRESVATPAEAVRAQWHADM